MKSTKVLAILVLALGLMGWFSRVSRAEPVGTAWTYQGRLLDADGPADGLYDFQFKLYDSNDPCTGEQMGGTININDLDVIDGYFIVELDFGGDVFNGDARWLETTVANSDGSDPYTLSPRRALTPAPYAIYAQTSGGDNDWMVVGNDMYSIPSGNVGIGISSPSARLDVDGDISTSSVYKIGGDTVLSIDGTLNVLVGVGAGANNTGVWGTFMGYNAGNNNQGNANTFLGYNAGSTNNSGNGNTFVGESAGKSNTTGRENTFLGTSAGENNISASENTFLGAGAGSENTAGGGNTFIGYQAGTFNVTGMKNTFVGTSTGSMFDIGSDNTFLGYLAGRALYTGDENTFLGSYAGVSYRQGNKNTFVGYSAGYSSLMDGIGSDNTFVGAEAGYDNTSGYDNAFLGKDTGRSNSTGNENTFVGTEAGYNNTTGTGNVFIGFKAGYNINVSNKLYIANSDTNSPLIYGDFSTGRIGIGTTSPLDLLHLKSSSLMRLSLESTDLYAHAGVRVKTPQREYFMGINSNTDRWCVYDNIANAERLTVASNGNVGIGTTSPTSKFHVFGDLQVDSSEESHFITGDSYVFLQPVADDRGRIGFYDSSSGWLNLTLNEAGGNVGIGTTTPGHKLDVHGTISTGGSGTSGRIRIHPGNQNSHFWIDNPGLGYLRFSSGASPGSNPMRLSSTGDVDIAGHLTKGSGSFKIDHPLDPENKYLSHSFVESPDMMNVYNGNAVLDKNGEAVVRLPDYFEALNKDFRYQLTCIGGFAPVYVAQEISENQFKIAGGKRGMKVSWQVTGVRQDAYAEAKRIAVEENKPTEDRGYYLYPQVYGFGEDKSIQSLHVPEPIKQVKEDDESEVSHEKS